VVAARLGRLHEGLVDVGAAALRVRAARTPSSPGYAAP
jgi:hypothetical protein